MTSLPTEPLIVLADEVPEEVPVKVRLLPEERITPDASMCVALNKLFTLSRPASVATREDARSAEIWVAPAEPTRFKTPLLRSTDAKGAATRLTTAWAVATGRLVWVTVMDWPSLKTITSTVREPSVKAERICAPRKTDS